MSPDEEWRGQIPGSEAIAGGPSGFQAFAIQVRQGDTVGAGATLMGIMGLSPVSAQKAAAHFVARFERDPSCFQQALAIRAAVTEGRMNDALEGLETSFGLEGLEVLTAVSKLKDLVDAG